MAYTDNCDIYSAFHEEGFNRLLHHVQLQRPSLFNYATKFVAERPELLCQAVAAHPIVGIRNNPKVTVVAPLPVPGTNYGLNYALQLVKVSIDFHPSNSITLPAELGGKLKEQSFALEAAFCGGIGCPPDEIIDRYVPPPGPDKRGEEVPGIFALDTKKLLCFCLAVTATGAFRIREHEGRRYLEPILSGIELTEITPAGLEDSLECYIRVLLKLTVLPKLRILLKRFTFDAMKNVGVALLPTPISQKVKHNPAVEQDQLKVFINLEVI